MKNKSAYVSLSGITGKSGHLDVFLGNAPANTLFKLSFPDILNEDTGEGYQRPYSRSHSIDFKNYIVRAGSASPPLIFNLRSESKNDWKIERGRGANAWLIINKKSKCLAQVDCQHRLSELADIEIPLPFMTFIGLNLRQEMAIFNVINSKARGLSSSLTDYHNTKLLDNLALEAPQLYLAKRLNEDVNSPWYHLIKYGGESTSGLRRRTSFRMMQKTIHLFLSKTKNVQLGSIDEIYEILLNYWIALKEIFRIEWSSHRRHLITKGVGLYSLMQLLSELVIRDPRAVFNPDYFENVLIPLRGKIDWSSDGRFAYVGGKKGVQEVFSALREGLQI